MTINNITKITVTKTDPKRITGTVVLTVNYNDNEQYEIDFRNDPITIDTLVIFFGYYFVLDRTGYLDSFYRLVDECELIVNHETYREFTVQERLSKTNFTKCYKTETYETLKHHIEIDWDKFDVNKIINYELVYIDDEKP